MSTVDRKILASLNFIFSAESALKQYVLLMALLHKNYELAGVVSSNNVTDNEAFEDILDAVSEEVEAVSADGADDKRKCYQGIEEREARGNIAVQS